MPSEIYVVGPRKSQTKFTFFDKVKIERKKLSQNNGEKEK